MTPLLQSPALLLLAVGTLLGLNFPLGKLAQAAQVPAVLWAALISLGASSLLGAWLLLRRRPVVCDAQHARYFVITALVSYALPNLLVLAAMAHLGSGPTAMMFTLSPLFTALLSRLAGLRAPARLEYWGIAIGFGGALLVALARGEAGRPAAWLWVGVGLLIPLLLALGNVYRSLDWPPRADGTWLAVGSHGVAALLLLALCALTGAWRGLPALAGVPWLAAAQVAAAVLMFPLFFRLQALGGPVLLSQIGTVGAGVGVAVGAGLLGERYPPLVWGGVALIALGIGLTVWARRGT
ncbi:MAG: EamA family transporter [Ottowia sp.]|nr:EamA family transporter [Ottowia sp.]MBP7456677.1 EamA family transporter [Ottowia sp.]MBP9524541.1 EamA family transporter [Ottowia sp.]HRL30925.1 EamA family transporter [Ottowia sp.]HRL67759.1 EamA family transporter [Ottowia sp.]